MKIVQLASDFMIDSIQTQVFSKCRAHMMDVCDATSLDDISKSSGERATLRTQVIDAFTARRSLLLFNYRRPLARTGAQRSIPTLLSSHHLTFLGLTKSLASHGAVTPRSFGLIASSVMLLQTSISYN